MSVAITLSQPTAAVMTWPAAITAGPWCAISTETSYTCRGVVKGYSATSFSITVTFK